MLKVRAIVAYPNRTGKTYIVKFNEGDEHITVAEKLLLNIDPEKGVFMGKGRKRMLTYFYNSGNANPINMLTGASSAYTPAQMKKLSKSNNLSKLLGLLKQPFDLTFIAFIILAIVVVGGLIYIGWKLETMNDVVEITTTFGGWE